MSTVKIYSEAWRKKIGEANKRAFADPEVRRKLSEKLKAKYDSGTRKKNPEGTTEKIMAKIREGRASGRLKPWKLSEETRKKIGVKVSIALAGRATRKTPRSEAERKALSERTKANPLTAAGLENIRVKSWRLRSPRNVVYEFRNLRMFVEQNEHLFAPEDVVWKRKHKGHGVVCSASNGLGMLSIRKKHPIGSWKGWTWHSQTERIKNDGKDLLDRREP